MIDTHCHLTHPRFDVDRDAVIASARSGGLWHCITIGTGVEDARRARDLARTQPGFLSASAGLDPFSSHAAGDQFESALEEMRSLHEEGGFVAWGEIGLDYHYDLDPRPVQAERLERQLDHAAALDRAVVIHVREAHDDMVAILRRHARNRGVIHSFAGGPDEARNYLDLGWMLSFNGVLTFRNAESAREAARYAPRASLLVETDAPYLAPVPKRGLRCEPAWVGMNLDALAVIRGETSSNLRDATAQNARSLFGLGS